MSNNVVINNILSENQRLKLLQLVNQSLVFLRIEESTGRSRIEFEPLNPKIKIPEDILTSIQNYFNNNNLILESCYFAHYSLQFGIPKLAPHLDNHSAQYTIDYCLDSNCDWPVVVEGKEFLIPINGALTIDTNKQFHWRKPKKFTENEYVKMIFFHFTDNTRSVVPIDQVNKDAQTWRHLFDEETNLIK